MKIALESSSSIIALGEGFRTPGRKVGHTLVFIGGTFNTKFESKEKTDL